MISTDHNTWAYLSFIQPKKRSRTNDARYWYTDTSMILLSRSIDGEWTCAASCVQGVQRICQLEVFLESNKEYCCVPLSLSSEKRHGNKVKFQFVCYSAQKTCLKSVSVATIPSQDILSILHKELLKDLSSNCVHSVADGGVIVHVTKPRCVYFVVINASKTYLSVKLHLALMEKSLRVQVGNQEGTYDVAPFSQQIISVVQMDGTGAWTDGLPFSFISHSIPSFLPHERRNPSQISHGIELTIKGECLAVEKGCWSPRGDGIIDLSTWNMVLGTSNQRKT